MCYVALKSSVTVQLLFYFQLGIVCFCMYLSLSITVGTLNFLPILHVRIIHVVGSAVFYTVQQVYWVGPNFCFENCLNEYFTHEAGIWTTFNALKYVFVIKRKFNHTKYTRYMVVDSIIPTKYAHKNNNDNTCMIPLFWFISILCICSIMVTI